MNSESDIDELEREQRTKNLRAGVLIVLFIIVAAIILAELGVDVGNIRFIK